MYYLLIIVASLFSTTALADEPVWQDIQARTSAVPHTPLQTYRRLSLDEATFKAQLNAAASVNATKQARGTTASVQLPLPTGGFTTVTVETTQVLAPEVAADHPDIQTWRVYGTDDQVLSGVLDMTSSGFHAMLSMNNGETLFIDPQELGSDRQYLSFSQQANRAAFEHSEWICPVHGKAESLASSAATLANRAARPTTDVPGQDLHTYRLAMAATGEYTQYFGSQSKAYNAIVTAVNRINEIYQRDLAIKLQLVSNTNIVYTNPNTDPYDNGSPNTLLNQNDDNLNAVIGSANYDIGHVLGTAGGGLASVGVVCGDNKAEGSTGLSTPTGDSFIIDYIAHEIGHQFGASHTFNGVLGSCSGSNREDETAFEPGSGSTIMAYTGLCQSDDLQTDSDIMMHSASIAQIQAYAFAGAGAVCAGQQSLNNHNPTAQAGNNYTIPASTPFILSGTGSDVDGDTLSYSWEQLDAGSRSYVNVDLGDNALIRAHTPSASPLRTVPPISDLINRTQSVGEYLPVQDRVMNFRLEARDSKGGTGYQGMTLTVKNTGSAFAITAPTTTSFVPGSPLNVTWNVAGTNSEPINCSAVNIDITTDKGNSFTTLLANTPNNGSATVTLPTSLGSANYLRVKCSNNIFFALSNSAPAKASATNVSNTNTTNSNSTSLTTASSSGGGGSLPLGGLLLGVSYALYRVRRHWSKAQ